MRKVYRSCKEDSFPRPVPDLPRRLKQEVWDVSGVKWDVGVVGAGPGGLSTAHELQKTGKFNITVFEAGSKSAAASTRVRWRIRRRNFYVEVQNTEEAAKSWAWDCGKFYHKSRALYSTNGKFVYSIPSVCRCFGSIHSIKSQFRLIKMF